ncbi:hypothetical protein SAMN06296241_2771 [Salinimicrobium sediminis]|uniref:Uncharacterized protein n=1 Tax=Salinimicrobium sediminis TaxID=1343891 RepID=A0A285X7D5_9FLAO|nr:hypothetical protein [Salinimicrobium sediminis]MDX1753562.1 hypothetical protein [Salinimicrobium sediminis]SOC81198.1 hypothetical protein SAMN06296241_2771 [Salinimicrobium sediminis]
MKLVIQLVLWIVIIFLGYLVFNSIYEPIKFNEVKEARYAKVINNLKDIRDAELAHRTVTGKFEGDWDKLVRFLDTAQFTLTQRRDTTVMDEEYRKTYGVDRRVEIVVIDTLGYKSIKDSLFQGTDRYKTMMNVPIQGVDQKFELKAGTVSKNDTQIPVFEAKIPKAVVLYDQDKDLVNQAEEIVGVDEVPGPYISVGSMEEVKTSGNWPLKYGDAE